MLVTAYSDREKMLFFIGIHICYITLVMVASFLCNSCGHPQDQTVPSSVWDAPCPVVTPSSIEAWLGVFCFLNYTRFSMSYKTSSFEIREQLQLGKFGVTHKYATTQEAAAARLFACLPWFIRSAASTTCLPCGRCGCSACL